MDGFALLQVITLAQIRSPSGWRASRFLLISFLRFELKQPKSPSPHSGLTQPPRGQGSARVALRPQHLPPGSPAWTFSRSGGPSWLEWTAPAVALGGTQCPSAWWQRQRPGCGFSSPSPVALPECTSPLGPAGTAAGEGPARSPPRPRGPCVPRCFGAGLNAD